MEKGVERKIGLIHAVAGALVGAVTGYFHLGGTLNLLGVIMIGIAISYPLKLLTAKLFNLSSEEYKFKDWLAKGFLVFFGVWIVAWTFFYNWMM